MYFSIVYILGACNEHLNLGLIFLVVKNIYILSYTHIHTHTHTHTHTNILELISSFLMRTNTCLFLYPFKSKYPHDSYIAGSG